MLLKTNCTTIAATFLESVLGADPLKYLAAGAIGVGFFLMILAFTMLWREQGRPAPRIAILRSIYILILASLTLCAMGVFEKYITREISDSGRLRDLDNGGYIGPEVSPVTPGQFTLFEGQSKILELSNGKKANIGIGKIWYDNKYVHTKINGGDKFNMSAGDIHSFNDMRASCQVVLVELREDSCTFQFNCQ